VHHHSADVKTQRLMRDILEIAQNAAIQAARRLEGEIKEAEAKHAAKRTKPATKSTKRTRRKTQGEAEANSANLH
jgi:hypothetical protein